MRYRLTVTSHGALETTAPRKTQTVYIARNISLSQAWKYATKHGRRAQRLYGGDIVRSNWGMRGGDFPQCYRYAVITLEPQR